MKYTGLSLGPSPPISFLDVLLIVRGASRVESEQKLWVLVRFWRRKKCKTVGNFLFGFTLHHAHYMFIRVTNDLVYYPEDGWQCCFVSLSALLFDKLGSSACCHWTAENVDHILEFGNKMNLDSLQEGLIPYTETLSISNLPFAVRWIAESSKAIDLPTLSEGQNWSIKYILNQAQQQLLYLW